MTAQELAEHFRKVYGDSPRMYQAPGRVNLIGEHTDYNEGFVMPAGINFCTRVAIAARTDRKLVIRSDEFEGELTFDLDRLPERSGGGWSDYVVGVAVVLGRRGFRLSGANLLVRGEVPIGAGLSSSAAVEVASALALMSVNGKSTGSSQEQASSAQMSLPEVAKLCREAENSFVGARVGIMDQFVSCMAKAGHAVVLDCRSLEFELVPIPAEVRLVICNTMVKHELSSGSYNLRREECEAGVRIFAKYDAGVRALRDVSGELFERYADELPSNVKKRVAHVIQENQRVLDAAGCLRDGDLTRLGELMRASHWSLRDLYEVSCRELDIMVEAAEGLPGYYGGRMTGGGFGGCTVNLVNANDAQDFAVKVAKKYQTATGIKPDVYICATADGARALP